uniref:Uncharacterized protein n=1 Tax=Acrobeloides nanus TaxID=290746 RepID=A0A914DVA1_9BILA
MLIFWLLINFLVQRFVYSAFCGNSAIPFRFEVVQSGDVILGCASPSCFGTDYGGKASLYDTQFQPVSNGLDGYIREGDQTRNRFRFSDAPGQQAKCTGSFTAPSCSDPNSWVGGIEQLSDGSLGLQCCEYNGLKFAQDVGHVIIHPGEAYSGGEVIRDGRQTGFDLISDVRQVVGQDGNTNYELAISRMNCLPDPPEELNEVEIEGPVEIVRILDKVVETPISEGGGEIVGENGNDQVVKIGEAVVPVQSSGFYYPVSGSKPACFSGDMLIRTKRGQIFMDELKIGDFVESADENITIFSEVTSFLHRLSGTTAYFIEIETEVGNMIKLTPQHFIYKTNCEATDMSKIRVVYAENVHIGDCLLRQMPNGGFTPARVTQIQILEEIGIFAPMTESGNIVVNGILASCYNIVKSQSLMHTLLQFIQTTEQNIRSVFSNINERFDELHIPLGIDLLYNIFDNFVPNHVYESH